MTSGTRERILVVGARGPGGAEIVQRLEDARHQVHPLEPQGLAAWLAGDATGSVDALVVHLPMARSALSFAEVDDVTFMRALQTCLVDVVGMTQAVLPRMGTGARIVYVGPRGHLGAWGGVHLMAASAGLVAMARSMALELAADGIRVNTVATEFVHDRGDTPDLRAAVAHTVEFLCAPALGMSGQTLLVDGQAALRMSESRNQSPSRQSLPPAPTDPGRAPP